MGLKSAPPQLMSDLAHPARVSARPEEAILWRGPVLFFRWHPEPPTWPVSYVSENVKEVLGYTVEDFMDGSVTLPGMTHPDDLGRVEQEVIARLASRCTDWTQEYRVITRAGDVRWFHDWNQAAYDGNGDPVLLQSLVLDITDRKRMEDSLRSSERKYRLLYESLRDAFVRVDMDGRLEEFNQAYVNMLRYPPDQLRKLTYRDVTPEAWHAMEEAIIREQVMVRGYSDVYEKEYRRRDGTVFPIELRTYLLRDEHGIARGMWAIVRDISARKAAEAELAASERKYRQIVETAQEGIWIIDVASKTTFVNGPMAAMLGYTVDEMMARPLFDFMDDEGRRMAERNVQRRKEGITEQHEFVFRHKAGHRVWTLIETCPFQGEDGAYCGSLAMIMDITARHKAEEDRFALQASEQKMQKIESLGLMAGGVAHDFNNILTTISGNLDLATSQVDPSDPVRSNLHSAQLAVDRAAQLCRHMLTFSGGGHVARTRRNLTEQLRAWCAEAAKTAPSGVRLRLNAPPSAMHIEMDMDAAQLRQALLHLIENAVEAMGEQGGTVTVSANVRSCTSAELDAPWMPEKRDPGLYAVLTVSDTGPGMDEATLQRIFDPFFSTKFTGRGMGLPAVLGVVRMHKGSVKAFSQPGVGTTITLLLPLAADAPRSPPPAMAQSASGANAILVADDEPTLRVLCRQMLGRLGFDVLTAEDGVEAVALYRQNRERIRGVLLDVTMPRMGGAEALQEIRKLDPAIPAVITSGYSQQDVDSRFADTPFQAFLQKPFNTRTLAEAMRKAVSQASA